jgi:arylsulfatase
MSGLGPTQLIQTGAVPWVFNLHVDPQEHKIGNNYQYDLVFEPALPEVKRHLATFKKYPMKELGLNVGR